MKKKLICLIAALVLLCSMTIQVYAMQVFVQVPTGKYLTIEVKPDDTIAAVKEIISEKTGVPAKRQRLFYDGKELEDNNALWDYSIQQDCILTIEFLRTDVIGSGSYDIVVTGEFVEGQTAATTYKVDIAWGAMEFTYTAASQGEWNPATHRYDNVTEAGWSCADGANEITATNHSNTAVNVTMAYSPADGYADVSGSFDSSNFSLATAVGTEVNNAPSKTVKLTLDGALDAATTETKAIGTITVTISDAE